MAPKCLQNASKAAPKAPSYAKNDPKAAPNATQSHLAYQNEPQRDSKVAPKSTSYAPNVLQVPPKSPSYAKGNTKLTPKSHRDAPKATLICQKWSQSDSKATPELYKTIKIYWENECFSKLDQSDSKVTLMYPKSYKNNPKVSKSATAHSVLIFPGTLVALLNPQNSWEK